MPKANRLSKLVKTTSRLPKALRTRLWSQAFGRIVPMVGSANIRYLQVSHSEVVVKIENHRAMQNHIGQLHACAMALIAETATGFVTGMNVPDHCIVLIKSMHVDFKRPSKGAMTATASLTPEQQQLMQTTARGETLVSVTVMDESGEAPVQCEMLWAWLDKASLKK